MSCEKHSAVPLEYRWHASVQSESLRLGAAPDQNLGNHSRSATLATRAAHEAQRRKSLLAVCSPLACRDSVTWPGIWIVSEDVLHLGRGRSASARRDDLPTDGLSEPPWVRVRRRFLEDTIDACERIVVSLLAVCRAALCQRGHVEDIHVGLNLHELLLEPCHSANVLQTCGKRRIGLQAHARRSVDDAE